MICLKVEVLFAKCSLINARREESEVVSFITDSDDKVSYFFSQNLSCFLPETSGR